MDIMECSCDEFKSIFSSPQFEDFVQTYMSEVFSAPEYEGEARAPTGTDCEEKCYCFDVNKAPMPAHHLLAAVPSPHTSTSACVNCFATNVTLSANASNNSRGFANSSAMFNPPRPLHKKGGVPKAASLKAKAKTSTTMIKTIAKAAVPFEQSLSEFSLHASKSSESFSPVSPSPSPPSSCSSESSSPSPSASPSPPNHRASSSSSLSSFYFTPLTSATSPSKSQKAPYSTLPNTEIRLERTPLRKVIWTPALHEHFLSVLSALDPSGEGTAKPRDIVERMGVPGLTRANISSHLQKYKLKCKSPNKHSPSSPTGLIRKK